MLGQQLRERLVDPQSRALGRHHELAHALERLALLRPTIMIDHARVGGTAMKRSQNAGGSAWEGARAQREAVSCGAALRKLAMVMIVALGAAGCNLLPEVRDET